MGVNINFILIVLLAIILFGAAVLLTYFFAYKANINKSVTAGESEAKRHRMPAPSSAVKTVIAVVLAVLIVLACRDISSLKDEIENIGSKYNDISQRLFILENEIYSLNEQLNKENELFTTIDISYGRLDAKNHSATISITASPKSCTDEAKISLFWGDYSCELSKIGAGLFSGKMEIDLYSTNESDALITITDEGKTVSTAPYDQFYLDIDEIRANYAAAIHSHIDMISLVYDEDMNSSEHDGSGKVNMTIYRTVMNSSEDEEFLIRDSFKLVVESEGSIILEYNLPYSDSESPDSAYFEIKKSFELPKTANRNIYITAKDKCGNTHICDIMFTAELPVGENIYTGFYGEKIYDSKGNLIA